MTPWIKRGLISMCLFICYITRKVPQTTDSPTELFVEIPQVVSCQEETLLETTHSPFSLWNHDRQSQGMGSFQGSTSCQSIWLKMEAHKKNLKLQAVRPGFLLIFLYIDTLAVLLVIKSSYNSLNRLTGQDQKPLSLSLYHKDSVQRGKSSPINIRQVYPEPS